MEYVPSLCFSSSPGPFRRIHTAAQPLPPRTSPGPLLAKPPEVFNSPTWVPSPGWERLPQHFVVGAVATFFPPPWWARRNSEPGQHSQKQVARGLPPVRPPAAGLTSSGGICYPPSPGPGQLPSTIFRMILMDSSQDHSISDNKPSHLYGASSGGSALYRMPTAPQPSRYLNSRLSALRTCRLLSTLDR